MHNISWRIYEIPIETKKQNERPRRLEGTISGSKEWLEEMVAKGFLTEDEENFFNELENPVEIKEIAKKIISELCKRICDWENPSRKLFEQVCNDITRMRSGMYPWYTKAVLGQLPDRKKIADLFESDNTNSNKDVEEFRKKRKEYMNSKINAKLASPDDPIHNEIPVNPEPKKEKIKAKYEAISDDKYYGEKSQYFTRTEDIKSDIPLLENEDVCIWWLFWWSWRFTNDTKVPFFDARPLVAKEFKELWIKYELWKTVCIYNSKDDISHIMVLGNDAADGRSAYSACLMISIKGKISNEDAKDLIKYLKDNTNLKFDPFRYCINDYHSINWTNIQETIIKYFNNK